MKRIALPSKKCTLALSALSLATAGAWGQTALETVVITAQKRPEKAQTTPLSVFAVTGETLENTGVDGISGLDRVAAGLTVGGVNPGQFSLSLRGISNLGGGFFTGPATGVYLDETPISAFASIVPELAFWDAERVEVLRGPQGTLFGEGSMGGTLRVITVKPDAKNFEARAQLGGSKVSGGDTGYTARFMLNVPVVKDSVGLRVNAARAERPGWIDVPDLNAKDANDAKQEDVRVALRFTPNPNLTADLSFMHQRLENGEYQSTSPGVFRPSDLNPAASPVTFFTSNRSRNTIGSATVAYDLGPATVTGTLSHFEQHLENRIDHTWLGPLFFGAPASIVALSDPIRQKATTAELRASSNGDNVLNWTVGAYGKRSKPGQTGGFVVSVPALGITDDRSIAEGTGDLKAHAIFGDLEYRLTDRLALQAGVRRYQADYAQKTVYLTSSAIFGSVAGTTQLSEGSASATSPKLGFSYRLSDATMIYGRYAKGFRDGGANVPQANQPVIPKSFGPEQVTAYELGVKSQPMPWLSINASVYQNTWSDLQLGFVTPDGLFAYIANAGKAKSVGGEIEVLARPAAGLTLGLNIASVDAKIRETVLNALGGVIATEGNRIPFSPRLQASVFGNYSFDLTGSMTGFGSFNYSHRGKTFSEPTNDKARENGNYDNLYLKAGVRSGAWAASLFVANALNSTATQQKTRYIAAAPLVFSSYVQPRTIGFEIDASF